MKLQRPQLPAASAKDAFGQTLVFKLKQILTQLVDQLNNLTEGQLAAVQNAQAAAPTTGTYQRGDFVRNNVPSVQGTAGAQYVVLGWLCVSAGSPGVFVACRAPTGT